MCGELPWRCDDIIKKPRQGDGNGWLVWQVRSVARPLYMSTSHVRSLSSNVSLIIRSVTHNHLRSTTIATPLLLHIDTTVNRSVTNRVRSLVVFKKWHSDFGDGSLRPKSQDFCTGNGQEVARDCHRSGKAITRVGARNGEEI